MNVGMWGSMKEPNGKRKRNLAPFGEMCYPSRMGKEGGIETLRRYGKEHFKELGKRGFAYFTSRYFDGDKQAASTARPFIGP